MNARHKISRLLLIILAVLTLSSAALGQAGAPPAATPGNAPTQPNVWQFGTPEYYSSVPEVRVKDIARVLGVRGNQLYGIGLVTGLAGTGDNASSVTFTAQAIANMLDRAGIPTEPTGIKVKNFAVVMVTADFPAFAREGDTMDITVSAMGDASSLQGGVLIMTPLNAANGEIYAVAQGPISLAGFSAGAGGGGAGARQQTNFLTVGRIPGGAYVEREVDFPLTQNGIVTMVLIHPDFTTAIHLRDAVAAAFPSVQMVNARDAASIEIQVPDIYQGDIVRFISEVENLKVSPDIPNKVIINERTGTIVMGAGVQIIPVAIAHGSLSITMTQGFDVSQPPPLSGGFSLATPTSGLTVEEGRANFVRISSEDLVAALNALGATPRDIVAIFQALDAAGALQAELEVI
jgi:flagellar P-ring protein precursor FlgI